MARRELGWWASLCVASVLAGCGPAEPGIDGGALGSSSDEIVD